MAPPHEPFQPEDIDERIEWLAQQEAGQEQDQSAQLVKQLQRHYAMRQRQEILERAWEQLAQRFEETAYESHAMKQMSDRPKKGERFGQNRMQEKLKVEKAPGQHIFSQWGLLVAAAVLVLLIGSAAFMMNQSSHLKGSPASGGGHGPVVPCVVTPMPVSGTGTVSTPQPMCATATAMPVTPAPMPGQGVTPTTIPVTATATPVTPTTMP